MSYSIQSTSAATAQCRLAARPMIGRPADVRIDGDAPLAGGGGDVHACQHAAAHRGVGLEHVGRTAPREVVELAGGVHPLADGDRDRAAGRQPGEVVDAHLRHGLLEEADAERRQRGGDLERRAGVVEPVRVDADEGVRSDVVADGGDGGDVVGHRPPEAHLEPAEAVGQRVVEVVGVVVGRLLEHRRARAVQPQRTVRRAEQAVQRLLGGLADDVPAGDLDRGHDLAREPLPAEVAIEDDVQLAQPAADVGRIGAEQRGRAHVADGGHEHGRVHVAPVRARLAPAHEPRVGLDAQRRRSCAPSAGRSCGTRGPAGRPR